jgi:Glyoxalase-like domain
MRLDHVSYVASHDQISDVVNRIGSQIGTAFIDGGIHPKFGTRNFTAPLLNGQYIEVVCPMDHPATDATPFGRAVKKKSEEGGGWLSWVFNVDDISLIEDKFGRKAVEGNRKKPDGTELRWKQIGVKDIFLMNELPFFVQWQTKNHPSEDGTAEAKIKKLYISSENKLEKSFFKKEIDNSLTNTDIEWINPSQIDNFIGIDSVDFETRNGLIGIK